LHEGCIVKLKEEPFAGVGPVHRPAEERSASAVDDLPARLYDRGHQAR
jgi:hypothetical protein